MLTIYQTQALEANYFSYTKLLTWNSCDKITDKGLEDLGDSLKKQTSLKSISLSLEWSVNFLKQGCLIPSE